MAQRTTRASRGEHTTGGAAAAAAAAILQSTAYQGNNGGNLTPNSFGINSTNDNVLSLFSVQKHIKVRKWRRVLVKVGQLKIPKWITDTEAPNEDLQNISRQSNKRALHKKAANSRSKRRVSSKNTRHEVIGELDDWEN